MSVLGAVSVTTTAVVKVVSAIGIAVGGALLGLEALNMLAPGFLETSPTNYARLGIGAVSFLAGLAGWHLGHRVGGQLQVSASKSAQEAELQRLQSYHGVAL